MTVSWNITVSFWTATAACGIFCSLASCLFFICLYPFPRNMHRTAFRTSLAPFAAAAAAGGVLGILCITCRGLRMDTIFFCIAASLLSAITAIDLSTLQIPNRGTAALFFLAICNAAAFSAAEEGVTLAGRVIGFAAAVMPFVIPVFLTRSMGAGDLKLMAVCGFLVGWPSILTLLTWTFFLSSAAALLIILPVRRSRKALLPFAPFIMAGTMIALL